MPTKIAVAIIHGIGREEPDFADGMAQKLRKQFAEAVGDNAPDRETALAIQPVYWAPILQKPEDELWRRLKRGGEMDFTALRQFLIDFAGDAIAYQPTPTDRRIYDEIHTALARTLKRLAGEAGEKVPLCIIGHSLGSVIASNYLYDLQIDPARNILSGAVRAEIGNTPLERGETLTLFYSLGSPLAIYSLRYPNFDQPVTVPAPLLSNHYPKNKYPKLEGEWVNYYDRDDVLGYPIKTVSEAYRQAVAADREINVGGIVSNWNPLSHMKYWTDDDVTRPIAKALAKTWRAVNP